MMRRIMAMMIMCSLFLSAFASVGYADVKSSILTKVEIEKLARQRLDLDDSYKLVHSNLHTRDLYKKQFWNLEFEKGTGNISVSMAADTGTIVSFNNWNNDSYGKPVTVLEKDAKKTAVEFIQSLEKEKFKETEEVTVKAPTIIPYGIRRGEDDHSTYSFMFVRKMEGEFFTKNYFRITVSGAGEVTSYEMQWDDDATYAGNKPLLSEEKVKEIFGKEDRLVLKYVALNKYNNGEGKNVVITPVYIYAPVETDKIDAITGKLLSYEELYNWNFYEYPFREELGEMVKDGTSNQTGGAEMIPEKGVLSKEKAAQIVVDMLSKHIDLKDIQLKSSSYTNGYAGMKGKFWTVHWYSEENSVYLYAVLNAENGELLEISYRGNKVYPSEEMRTKSEGEKIDGSKYRKLAEETIKAILPKVKNELKFEVQSENLNGEEILVVGTRTVNNIPFDDNYVNISFNAENSEIMSFSYRWYDVQVQSQGNILSKDKAHDIFYNKVGFEKYLVQLKDQNELKAKGLELPMKELLPVYGLKGFNFVYIDAVAGKVLDYSGEDFKELDLTKKAFTDIAGTPYEKSILLMDKMGILNVSEDQFKPAESLLRKDALKWIIELGRSNKAYDMNRYSSSNNQVAVSFKDIPKDHPYYEYIKTGLELDIIEVDDYFRPDEKISKLELTKWMIHAMKQKELATYSDIFQVPYEDAEAINAADSGYVALAKYHNIFGDKKAASEFGPERNIERGEFIHNMYQFIMNYKDIK
ncbi:S-layer homology domain-containing protein [Alkaliphilus oremlandii]|uniref:S-layer domain protein n=1 Tax=Alkaliphilus oremlandii (strain OhILAs) TaxID=350688 RepID=A8MI70_ALKOO|nr:S-layer homology domain-containing protein [Alkaliphilus oremlandii]ABW19502.1 S-layer domain protein [Alkaliphilus oremlandii OhILAs]